MSSSRWVRIEVGITSPPQKTRDQVTRSIKDVALGVKVKSGSTYSQAMLMCQQTSLWHLVDAGKGAHKSLRLLSPHISSTGDISSCARVLNAIATQGKPRGLRLNSVTGLRLHVSAHGLSCASLVKICQNFVKYEDALDTLVPTSRRTGSDASNRFFRSNKAVVAKGQSSKKKNDAIAACDTVEALIDLFNPKNVNSGRRSGYKLNLYNLLQSQCYQDTTQTSCSTLEFRQHSVTSNIQKIKSWICLCLALVENSARLNAPAALKSSRTLDEQWDALFRYVIRDEDLRLYYQDRRRQLSTPSQKRAKTSTVKVSKKSSNEKKECECCFSMVSVATMGSCQDKGHLFCGKCINSFAKEQLFTNHGTALKCLSMDGCQSYLNTRQLQKILPNELRKRFREARYFRDEEASGNCICECPKCGSKGFVPKGQTTFFCPKEKCRHQSCRMCQEAAHSPIPCSQVEKQYLTNARTSVEEAMSMTRIRKCPKCHLSFIREQGCNSVTCTRCGTRSCYQCRAIHCTGTCTASTDVSESQQVKQAGTRKVASLRNVVKEGELDDLVNKLV